MKKILSILAICCICSAAVAQEFTDIDQIREGWTKKTITGVKNDKILTLVTAFNKVWHTQPATFLLKNPVHNEEGDEYNTNVDKDNGYIFLTDITNHRITPCVVIYIITLTYYTL